MFQGTQAAAADSMVQPQVGGDEIAARAIAFAQKYGTGLEPAVYQVWYAYAGRENAAINEALDLAMNTGQPISAGFLTSLFHEHMSPRAMNDELSDIGSVLQRTLGNVSEAMDENMRDTSVFSGTLRNARQNLMHGTSKRDVTEIIKQLHRANQEHLQSAQRLTVQLEKNRARVSKLKHELIEAKRASNTDYLTGLPNRRMLDEHLDAAIFEARQKKHPLTLLMGTIDNLDAVSREHGLSAGDSVMRAFADRIAKELRGAQIAARFAGAKFALMLPEVTVGEAFNTAEQIRKRFKALDWVSRESGAAIGALSVSFGGAGLKEGDTRETLVDRADTQLIRAQTEGADRSLIT